MNGIRYFGNFLDDHEVLLEWLMDRVEWDERMKARKTASFGHPYDYSQISYPYCPLPDRLAAICRRIKAEIGYLPNNCLINFYENGHSTMGYHSDRTDILAPGTGVAVLSLGAPRILRFRRIADKAEKIDFELAAGSLIYMDQGVQAEWQHAVPKSDTEFGRLSLTFREII